jgi:hypothetical protein
MSNHQEIKQDLSLRIAATRIERTIKLDSTIKVETKMKAKAEPQLAIVTNRADRHATSYVSDQASS